MCDGSLAAWRDVWISSGRTLLTEQLVIWYLSAENKVQRMTWHHRGSGFSSLMKPHCVWRSRPETRTSCCLMSRGRHSQWDHEGQRLSMMESPEPTATLISALTLESHSSPTGSKVTNLCMCSLKWSNRGLLLHWLAGWQLPKRSCSLSASPYSCDTWEGGKGPSLTPSVGNKQHFYLQVLKRKEIFRLLLQFINDVCWKLGRNFKGSRTGWKLSALIS